MIWCYSTCSVLTYSYKTKFATAPLRYCRPYKKPDLYPYIKGTVLHNSIPWKHVIPNRQIKDFTQTIAINGIIDIDIQHSIILRLTCRIYHVMLRNIIWSRVYTHFRLAHCGTTTLYIENWWSTTLHILLKVWANLQNGSESDLNKMLYYH